MDAWRVRFLSVASAILVRPALRPVVRLLTDAHARLYRWTGGRAQVAAHPTLLLTVTGRTTGRARTVPLVYVMDGERFAVAAAYAGSDRDPAWWLNLQADPTGTVEVMRRRLPVRATLAEPNDREALWRRLVAMYPNFTEYQQRTARPIPVIVLTPLTGNHARPDTRDDRATVEHWRDIAEARRVLADQLEALTPEQWAAQSLCGAWTVRHVVAHLVPPEGAVMLPFLVELLRARGSFDRANLATVARVAARPTADLLADLRRLADHRWAPPGMGSVAPLSDVLIHGQDIRVPLGLPDPGPAEPWMAVLDFLVSPKARLGFVARRLPDVRWVATDRHWTHGAGPEVRGTGPDLALTISGRVARLDALTGPGAAEVANWLRP